MARNPTLKRVRAWQAKQAKEDPAVDAGLAAGGLLLLAWLVLHPLVLAEWSVLGALGAALAVGLGVAFGGVLVGLVVSGLTGWRHGGVAGTALLIGGLAALSLRWYPPGFAAAVLGVGEGALALGYWRARVHRARSPFGLPPAVEAALAALPPNLSAEQEARLDVALHRQHQLAGLLAAAAVPGAGAGSGAGAGRASSETAGVQVAGVQVAAEAALLALVQQVAVQQRLAELPGAAPQLAAARGEAEAAVAALDAGLEGLVASSARVLASGQAAALAALRAEAEALQLSARAWAEVEAAAGEGAA